MSLHPVLEKCFFVLWRLGFVIQMLSPFLAQILRVYSLPCWGMKAELLWRRSARALPQSR
jgi:hypothetical protein